MSRPHLALLTVVGGALLLTLGAPVAAAPLVTQATTASSR